MAWQVILSMGIDYFTTTVGDVYLCRHLIHWNDSVRSCYIEVYNPFPLILNTPRKPWLSRGFPHNWDQRMDVFHIRMGFLSGQLWHMDTTSSHYITRIQYMYTICWIKSSVYVYNIIISIILYNICIHIHTYRSGIMFNVLNCKYNM